MRVFSHHPRHDGILFFLFSSNRFHGRIRQEELDRCRSRCPLSTSSNTWKAPLTSMMEFINVLPKLIFRWVDEPQADGLIREKILRYQRCKKNPLAGLENRDWQFNLMLEKKSNFVLVFFSFHADLWCDHSNSAKIRYGDKIVNKFEKRHGEFHV